MSMLQLFALMASGALALNVEVSMTSSLTFDAEAAKKRPVNKVITLLKDMLTQLEKEAKEDEEIYDKMACWCETNDKEKTKSIADAQTRISDLTSRVEELTAKSSELNTVIDQLGKEIDANKEALDKATAIRTKQQAEFNSEEKDLLSSISALKFSVQTLGKNRESLLQQPHNHVAATIAASVKSAMKKHASMLSGVFTHRERRAVTAFLQGAQAPDDQLPDDLFGSDEPKLSLTEAKASAPEYAPQGGEIFGILSQMKETFETNLANSQKEEMENQKAFEDLKSAKEEEINEGQERLDTKTTELADTDEKKEAAKGDNEDTKNSLDKDQKFLAMLKDKCQNADAEWEERQKDRQVEMEAVSKATAVLTADDAHDLFTKTFNPSLLQKQRAMHSERRTQVSKLLSKVANKVHNPRLATLAVKVRLDAFTRVKKSIDDMVTQLGKEKEDEIMRKDFCEEEFRTNEAQVEKAQREKEDINASIEDLEMTIKDLQDASDKTKAEVAENQAELKKAAETRDAEAKEFQETVADQRATQKLLAAALNVLKGVFAKKGAALLEQDQDSQEKQDPAAPEGFKTYKKNAGAPGVMGLIEQIIADAKTMEADAIRSEEDAKEAYEAFVKETNDTIEAKQADIVNKSQKKAKGETAMVEAKESKENVVTELEQLANSEAQLHQDCDFILKNFSIRQTAREEEIEALKQAKAILSGAKFEAFLQA